ncbi:hypothetical protein GE061_014224 [Apolygus lucorum]|uniref:Uncharacterized protein n=1 Tax=Apolygus lucorum TaxID=248454 RepID=A0A6A4KBF3_APOLU|nr:hypothetical protein GE061_014224 [Apolygus lucorum]
MTCAVKLTKESDDWDLDDEELLTFDIFTASSLGLEDVVKHHVINGQNLNEQNEGGWTALMYACASHRNGLVSYLLSMGAEITPRDHLGKTFLTVAAENENFKALSSLNEIGVKSTQEGQPKNYCYDYETIRSVIDLQEYKYGYTPLMYSATQGDIDTAKVLISMGADTTVKDANGRTAFDLSILNDHKTMSWMLRAVGTFTIRDVLEEIGLGKYSSLFENVTSEELLLMDDSDLKELGMKLLGPRKKLTLTIEKLKEFKENVVYRQGPGDQAWMNSLENSNEIGIGGQFIFESHLQAESMRHEVHSEMQS